MAIWNLLGIKDIIETVGNIADDLITTDKERLELDLKRQELELKGLEIEAGVLSKVHETNIEEARHPSLFVAGWRPAIGWIGAISLAYQFVLYPLLTWFWGYGQSRGWIDRALQPPPVMPAEALWTIVMGMLGIAGLRSFDKFKGVDTKGIGK